jgi:hypothetical protein
MVEPECGCPSMLGRLLQKYKYRLSIPVAQGILITESQILSEILNGSTRTAQ